MMQYDSPSILYKAEAMRTIPRTGDAFVPPNFAYDGTLAECIKDWVTQPNDQRSLYHLQTEAQEALGNDTILTSARMLEIASRDDFPNN
jgi:hypothetical protein